MTCARSLCVALVLMARPLAAQAAIDLTITSVSGPTSAKVGKAFSVSNTVRTTGAVSTSFSVGIYLSTDSVITTADTLVASRTVASLPTNGSSTATTTATVPLGLVPGTYRVGAFADRASAIVESNEANNARASTATITIVGPDLTVSALSGAPAAIAAGTGFNVGNTVAASSTGGDAGTFTVGIYLSTDNVITTADTLIGTRTVASLAAGSSSAATSAVVVPAALTAGMYYVGAIADPASQVPESSEANNSRLGSQLTVYRPDLTMTALTGAPAAAAPSSSFGLSGTATAAPAGAVGNFSVGFYLSTDATITTGDTLIGSASVGSLAAGASASVPATVTIPIGTTPGTYWLGAVADMSNTVAESSEANNAILGTQLAVSGADLAVTSLLGAPATIGVGDSFTVSDTVANPGSAGASASTMSFYLSLDTVVDGGDVLLGSRDLPALGAGASSSGSTVVTVPVGTTPGTYYLGAKADSGAVVVESNEANNTAVAAGTVAVGPYSCQHPATPIDDANPCTTDACDPATGVTHTPIAGCTRRVRYAYDALGRLIRATPVMP